jgi:hypothetical protein
VIDGEMGDKFFIKSIEKVKINSNIPEDLTVKKIVEKHMGKYKDEQLFEFMEKK